MKNIKHIGPNDKVRKPKPPTEEEVGLKHQI
jgi:hypothetical protein